MTSWMRSARALAALLVMSAPCSAQVIVAPTLGGNGVPSVPATVGVTPLGAGAALPLPTATLALSPVSSLTAVPALPAAALVPTAAAVSAAALPAAAKPVAAQARSLDLKALSSAKALTESPSAAALAGRRFFDGSADIGQDLPEVPQPATPARGQGFRFNGQFLPTRVFSDRTKPSEAIIRAIDASKVSIELAIHGLALRDVAAALLRAQKRGVKVRVVMNQTHVYPEKPHEQVTPEVEALIDAGVDLRILRGGDEHGIMHNKFALFDGQVVETGSYNWTHAADTWHWENALFFNDAARVKSFTDYWKWMWDQSLPHDRRPAPPTIGEDGHGPDLPPAPAEGLKPVRFNGRAFPLAAYSPKGVAEHIERAIDAAAKSIDIANFSFTNDRLKQALIRAKERGVRVRLVFDEDQYAFLSEMAEMRELGFDVRIVGGKDGVKGVQHNKFAVFDGALVETGSYNWTTNAERNNFENALFLDAPDDVNEYALYFERIRRKSRVPTDDDHDGGHGRHGFDVF